MDEGDKRILYYLDLNSRSSAKKLASDTGMKQEHVEKRLKEFFEQGVVRRCYPEIDCSKLGYYPFKLYLQFQNASPEIIEEIYRYLADSPNTGWIVKCSGNWDMIYAMWGKNVGEFNKVYELLLSKYYPYILKKVISITVDLYLANKKWLVGESAKQDVVKVSGVPDGEIDESDLKILTELWKDARMPIVDIANSLEMDPEEVDRKIKEMQKKKIILSFRTDLDLSHFSRAYCKSFVYLTKSSKKDEERLLDYCFRHPEITLMVKCVGPWDFEIEAHSKSINEFTEMMNDIRSRYPTLVRNFEAIVVNKESGTFFSPKKD
jgi:DNA-binding Lrp family transcriptional regulator